MVLFMELTDCPTNLVIIYRYDFKNLLHVAKTYGSASA